MEGGGVGGAEEVYEKTLPIHGDEYSHNLISTIQRNPGQVDTLVKVSWVFVYNN